MSSTGAGGPRPWGSGTLLHAGRTVAGASGEAAALARRVVESAAAVATASFALLDASGARGLAGARRLGAVAGAVVEQLQRPPPRRGRRSWVANGRAHLEVRGLGRSTPPGMLGALVGALEALDGVDWAAATVPLGRVVVSYDRAETDPAALLAAVEEVEAAHGLRTTRFPGDRPEHPGDVESLRRAAVVLVADVGALGLGVVGRLLQATPLPIELASLVGFVDSQPRLQRAGEHLVGARLAVTGLSVANAFAQGLAQGPSGLVVDGVGQLSTITALRARRVCWRRREPELCADAQRVAAPARDVAPRPRPLPRVPTERYAERAAGLSVAGAALALVATRSGRQAAAAALAAVPKAARVGPEAYAAELVRSLSRRDVVVCDRSALARLELVDTVVLDTAALGGGTLALRELVALGSDDRSGGARRQVRGAALEGFQRCFDPADPEGRREEGGWQLGPLDELDLPAGAGSAVAAELGARGLVVLGLARSGHLVALAGLAEEADRSIELLGSAVRRVGARMVVTGPHAVLAGRLADQVEARRSAARVVRTLQAAGAVVLAVSAGDVDALLAADCAVGVTRRRGPVPWGAHLLAPDLGAAGFVIDAVGPARDAARRSVGLSMVGSGVAAVLAFAGSPSRAGNRALLAVNLAAAGALSVGTAGAYVLDRRPAPSLSDATPWHAMTVATVLARLGPVSRREPRPAPIAPGRAGVLTPVLGQAGAFGRALVDELANPLTPVLIGGAALSAATGSLVDAGIIVGASGAGAVVGALQRVGTERAVEKLMRRSSVTARVLVHGLSGSEESVVLDARQLVVGDLVELLAGDVVPADCRLVESRGLECDESSLTGESYPVRKDPGPVFAASVAERRSMLYEGTTVVSGRARAVVVATGDATEAGRSAAAAPEAAPAQGVERRLASLTKVTVPLSLGAGAGVVALGGLRGRGVRQSVSSGVALAVAAVPEGLPFVVAAAQLAAARRLARRGVLVKNPRTVEALGRVEVLCFDKTGTLTEGRIRLVAVSDGTKVREIDGTDRLGTSASRVVSVALRATPEAEDGRHLAHPTDQALVEAASRVPSGGDQGRWRRLVELDFEPSRGYHATLGAASGRGVLSVKGAPEVVLGRCGGGDAAHARASAAHAEELAARGWRVLAVAERRVPAVSSAHGAAPVLRDRDVADLRLVGFVCLADAPRPNAAAAVARLREAGVQLVMITGDHPETARSVAEGLGILDGGRLVTGPELDELSPSGLAEVLAEATVCARVTPAHKRAIVAALQRAGRPVAMTGDGANDAPAIRRADVGVALGARATPAARSAADVVLVDERLETLLDALVEGRAMWGAVRDALAVLLGGNLGEIGFTLTTALLTGRSALGARQLLLVNLLTDLAPAMALAVRRPVDPESLLGEGPDRSLGESLDRAVLVRAGATSFAATTAWGVGRLTGRAARADTIALVAVVGSQLGQSIVAGRGEPRVLLTGVLSSAVLAAAIQTPGVSQLCGCTPLGPFAWATAIGSSALATAGAVFAAPVVDRLAVHGLQRVAQLWAARRAPEGAAPGPPGLGTARSAPTPGLVPAAGSPLVEASPVRAATPGVADAGRGAGTRAG